MSTLDLERISFGVLLWAIRKKALREDQARFAAQTDNSVASISKWENGHTTPFRSSIDALERRMGLSRGTLGEWQHELLRLAIDDTPTLHVQDEEFVRGQLTSKAELVVAPHHEALRAAWSRSEFSPASTQGAGVASPPALLTGPGGNTQLWRPLAELAARIAATDERSLETVERLVDGLVPPSEATDWEVRGLPLRAVAAVKTSIVQYRYDPNALTTPASPDDLIRVMRRDDGAVEVDVSRALAQGDMEDQMLAWFEPERHTARPARPERSPEVLEPVFYTTKIHVDTEAGTVAFRASMNAESAPIWPFGEATECVHILTAAFPAGVLLTEQEGIARTRDLEWQIRRQHPDARLWRARGIGEEIDGETWSEESVAVAGINRETAESYASAFGQRAWFILRRDSVEIAWPPR